MQGSIDFLGNFEMLVSTRPAMTECACARGVNGSLRPRLILSHGLGLCTCTCKKTDIMLGEIIYVLGTQLKHGETLTSKGIQHTREFIVSQMQ
jgi:hypothetical protein